MSHKRMKLYNTETREKEEITPLDGKTIRMYTCGPTVYNFAHIGNFRTYVFEDLLRRSLQFFGFTVKQAMNLTDIDDKTLKGAIENGVSLDAFTKPFKIAFLEDLVTLGIQKVEYYPEATEYVAEMISLIAALLEKGVAYRGQDESIYFAIAKFPSYGRLSHLDLDALKVGASERVSRDEYEKEHASDFVLWKAYDKERDGLIYWESPFGKGRPGWHIECSAMAMKLLGESIDIHVGGVDNMFPHHENEIAQCEAYSCCRFVKHWLHAEHLLVDHKKMSKSLGNFYTLRDLLSKGYTGQEVRYMLLQTHYRTQQNFTFEGLNAAVSTLRRLADFVARLKQLRKEKIAVALHLILDKALPSDPDTKELKDRLFSEMRDRDIFHAEEMTPILQRAIPANLKQTVLVKILAGIQLESKKVTLLPLIRRAVQNSSLVEEMLAKILCHVQDETESAMLDPAILQPILEKAFQGAQPSKEVVDSILLAAKEKKQQGFILPILQETMQVFRESLADDLNISSALAALFELVRSVNILCDEGKIGVSEAEDVLDFLKKIDQVLYVIPLEGEESIPHHLEEVLKSREEARINKDWKRADACREEILFSGYLIEDTPHGPRLKKKGVE